MTRIIKKYANRRLYDTEASCYITLDDVKELIRNNIEFKIISAKDETDLTNQVLLQVVGEAEHPMLTNVFLRQLIHFYHHDAHQPLLEFLEQSMSWFQNQYEQAQQEQAQMNPMSQLFDNWLEINQEQMRYWQKLMGLNV